MLAVSLNTVCHDCFIASVGASVEKRLGETPKKFRKSGEERVDFLSIIICYRSNDNLIS